MSRSWLGCCLLLVAAQASWAQGVVRLRSRTIHPAVQRGAARVAVSRGHHILQFSSYPGAELRSELGRRHIRVLGYVPESALMVSVERDTSLAGLGVTWSGELSVADKISAETADTPSPAYVVIFYADVDRETARALVTAQGLEIIDNPDLLAGQYLVAGPYSAVIALAERDEVSYIMAASPDLVAGNHVSGCAGPITDAGPVAEYATVGNGWPKDSSGNVALQYVFQSLTDKLDESTARGEIERAFREWQKYANVTLSPGTQADAVRTIAILFARGAHGDAYAFDGPGGVLAHTFYPAPPNAETVAGDMHFDADENWHAGTDTDLFTVALHEAGHALGLGHSTLPGAVMYPYYRLSTGLTSDDIAGIRSLYGTASVPTPTVPPAQPPALPPAQPPSQPPSQPPVVDTTPPSLSIASPGASISSTSASSIKVSGTAADNVGVTAVKWSTSNGDSGTASGTASWSATVPLLVGNTIITVRAYDASGNSGWRAVTVVRH